MSSQCGGWVQRRVGAPPRPHARLSLVCFHQAGSGSWMYDAFEQGLPDTVEVLPVELPGRNLRMGEPRLTSMRAVVDAAVAALAPALALRPFALFGHSMGGWVAFAVAQELQRCGGPLPLKLYASATRSPRLAGPRHDADGLAMHRLPAAAFWAAMERRYGPNPSLADPSVRRFVLPVLQADFQVIETWQPASKAPLACPVAAIGAEEDTRYTPEQLREWRDCAPAGAFQEVWVPGGHNYVVESPEQLLEWLSADVSQLLEGGPAGSECDGGGSADAATPADGGARSGPQGAKPQAQGEPQDAAAGAGGGPPARARRRGGSWCCF